MAIQFKTKEEMAKAKSGKKLKEVVVRISVQSVGGNRQEILRKENSAVMKNIAEATEISNLPPIMQSIFSDMSI